MSGFLYGQACDEPCGRGGRRRCTLTLGHGGGHDPNRTTFVVEAERETVRCPVCGGPKPGDITHTRCASTGYEGLG